MNFKNLSLYKNWIIPVFFSLIFAFIFRSFIFQPFFIPSGSMIPTLLVGDYLFVSKFSYGFCKYSFPFHLFQMDNRFGSNRPERGDVVVFNGTVKGNMDYIKRVVGLPGDRIQLINGIVYINYKPVELERICNFIDNFGNIFPQYLETLPGGIVHKLIKINKFGYSRFDNTSAVLIPDNYYFMMGDNRDNSSDSRDSINMGLIHENHLIGQANLIFFSISSNTFWKFWCWFENIRFNRFLQKIC